MSEKPVESIRFGRVAPCIPVRDLELAQAFYCGTLGFRKVFENGTPVGFMVLLKDGAELHLTLQRDHRATAMNVAHMFVDDVAALYAACQAAGVRVIKGLGQKDYGQQAFVLADPDGNRIDIGQRTS